MFKKYLKLDQLQTFPFFYALNQSTKFGFKTRQKRPESRHNSSYYLPFRLKSFVFVIITVNFNKTEEKQKSLKREKPRDDYPGGIKRFIARLESSFNFCLRWHLICTLMCCNQLPRAAISLQSCRRARLMYKQ